MRCTRRLTGLCKGRRKPERADIYFQIKDFIGSMVGSADYSAFKEL